MAAADPRVAMLAEMREPAFRLGMAFAADAERAEDIDRKIAFFQLFDRCGFAVRVGIALELRLERMAAARPQPREAASDREDLRDRETLADHDPPDRADRRNPGYVPEYAPEYDRERDRERERASFPSLIRALDGVVAAAAALPGPEPADLAPLRELLVRMKAGPPASAASKVKPRPSARLAAAGAALARPPAPRLASNVGQVLAARRATGPPRR
jgi:hypothetical protein